MFRGILAPASLKPGTGRPDLAPAEDVFRGILAPASLKQPEGPAGPARAARGVPGYSCPGLIEARWRWRGGWCWPRVPGYSCPGLIEAPLAKQIILADPGCSGVFLPRPH